MLRGCMGHGEKDEQGLLVSNAGHALWASDHPLYLPWETELLLVSWNLQKRSARPHTPTEVDA